MRRHPKCLAALLAAGLAACPGSPERAPVEVAGGLRLALALAADSANVYCIQATGSLVKIAKADGARTELSPVIDPYEAPPGSLPVIMADGFSVAVTSTAAFFTTFNLDEGVRTGIVWRVGLDGSGLVALARYPGEATAVAADESSLFVARYPYSTPSQGVIESAPHSGATWTPRASRRARPIALAADASRLYWLDAGVTPGDAMGGALASVPKAGGDVSVLATQLRAPRELQVSGQSVFWLDHGSCTRSGAICMSNGDGSIGEIAAGGGGTPDTLVHGRNSLASFAFAGDAVYFVDGHLYRMATQGLSPAVEEYAKTMPNGTGSAVTNIVADGDTLYWAGTSSEGRLVKLSTAGSN